MYITAIFYGVVGGLLLGLNIFLFLKDYSLVVRKEYTKKKLALNISGIVSSLGVIAFAISYFMTINSQLRM